MGSGKAFWIGLGIGAVLAVGITYLVLTQAPTAIQEDAKNSEKQNHPDFTRHVDIAQKPQDAEFYEVPASRANVITSLAAIVMRHQSNILNTPAPAPIQSNTQTLTVAATTPAPAPEPSQAAPEAPIKAALLEYSPDFRTIKNKGREWNISAYQAHVVKILWEHIQKGTNALHQDFLLEECEAHSKKMKDIFKGSKAWKTLIKPIGRGFYSLDLA